MSEMVFGKYEQLLQNKFHIRSGDWDHTDSHRHKYIEFAYLARGSIVHKINGKQQILNAGDYFIVDHGTVHSYKKISDEPLWMDNFVFWPEFLDRTLVNKTDFDDILNCYLLKFSYKTLKEEVTGRTFCDGDGSIRVIMDEIIDEYTKQQYGYLECIRSMFIKMLIITMRKVGSSGSELKKSRAVQLVCERVKKNYRQKLRLCDIARELGYSYGYLSALFIKEQGVGFCEYLQQIRIENACRLLEYTDMRVSSVAQAVGYEDIKFFNEIFKKQLGISPKAFQKLLV